MHEFQGCEVGQRLCKVHQGDWADKLESELPRVMLVQVYTRYLAVRQATYARIYVNANHCGYL